MQQSHASAVVEPPRTTSPSSAAGRAQVLTVASLLPEESRLGWYQNVRPWLRMLPPDEEVAHLVYSMGYPALPARSAPTLVAAERVKLSVLLQRVGEEISTSVKIAAEYHQKLSERITWLPTEIARGLNADALAEQIATSLREQCLKCGIPGTAKLLRQQADSLRALLRDQSLTPANCHYELAATSKIVNGALETVTDGASTAKPAIDEWNRKIRPVQWMPTGWALLIGVLLGWLVFAHRHEADNAHQTLADPQTPQAPLAAAPSGKKGTMHRSDFRPRLIASPLRANDPNAR
jgi:hypothetical protein